MILYNCDIGHMDNNVKITKVHVYVGKLVRDHDILCDIKNHKRVIY